MMSISQPAGEPNSNGLVYLDYAATTPVDPAVVEKMLQYMGPKGVFANASSSSHKLGQKAARVIESAREQVAELIGADPDEIVWTSGATESINLAIKGIVSSRQGQGRHILTSCLEHSAVLDTCRFLAQKGYEVTALKPDCHGLITSLDVLAALRSDTILVSLMHVNNEIGSITDIAAIGKIVGEKGIPFHVDAVQSAARLPLHVKEMNIDLLSLSGHKMYGPKGVGALYHKRDTSFSIEPQIHGGDQEQGMRAGTLATHQIVGMGKAAELIVERREQEVDQTKVHERVLLDQFASIPATSLNCRQSRVPGILNIRFDCVDNESLMLAISDAVALSSGSACTSEHLVPSHVLLGMGLSHEEASSSVRLSLGRFNTQAQLRCAGARIRSAVFDLRSLSDRWNGTSATYDSQ